VTRVLFVEHPESDYLSAVLYMGLCELLGPDNVCDFPHKPSYHGRAHTFPSPYERVVWPEDMSLVPAHARPPGPLPEGVAYTGPFEWMVPSPSEERSMGQVLEELLTGEFDLVILASPRKYAIDALASLVQQLAPPRMPPTVLVDGEDYQDIRHDLVERFKPAAYCKRELLSGKTCAAALHPLPLACPLWPLPQEEVSKDVDVAFLGGGSSAQREEVCQALRSEFGDRFAGAVGGHVSHRQYLASLARARVAVSVRGHGYDTLRYWEIPAMPGTLMAADACPLVRPEPFQHGRDSLVFHDTQDLVVHVRWALDDESRRAELARAGNEHLRRHHSAPARAAQLLKYGGITVEARDMVSNVE